MKHPLLNKQVRVFTHPEEQMENFEYVSTLAYICDTLATI
jgi:hypothetical protein